MSIKGTYETEIDSYLGDSRALKLLAIRADGDIAYLSRKLNTAKKELAELKASQNKVRADAVREAIKSLEHDCNGWAKDDQGRVYWHDKQILRVADEMEEGNE